MKKILSKINNSIITAVIVIFIILAVGFFVITTGLFRSAYNPTPAEEAGGLLVSLYEAEMSWYAAHHCYFSDPKTAGFVPPKLSRYEWAIVSSDCTGFVARAWADLDGDGNDDLWEITNEDSFRPLHVFDDKKDIGYRIPPRSTNRWRPIDGKFLPPVSDKQ